MSGLALDEAALRTLLHATRGSSQTLEDRLAAMTKLGDIGGSRGSPQKRRSVDVVFIGPPEHISTGDEARAFNLRYGRFDDCFSYRAAGPLGEGFYVTHLGRSMSERLGLEVPMPGMFETAPTAKGSRYRHFIKPRKKGGALAGKEVPEARFAILAADVREVGKFGGFRRVVFGPG